MKNLAGKYAIVTGAGKDIGAAIVKRFLEEEAAGVAIFEWDLALAEKTAKELDPTGKKVIAFKCDVSNSEQVKAAVDGAVAAFGRIDILINNAGVTRDRIFHKMTDEEWHTVININLNGIYNLCKYIVPMMRAQESGSIVNIGSTSGINGNPVQANYSATKAAVQGFTRTMAKELGPKGVRVNCIAPGHIMTDMLAAVGEDKLAAAAARIPMRRLGQPEELAAAVTFLCTEDASWVTGQTLIVSGGGTVN